MGEKSKSGNKFVENALPFLKEIVDKNGIGYLHEEPYAVYKSLASHGIDRKICRIVLVSLLAGAAETAEKMDGRINLVFRRGAY